MSDKNIYQMVTDRIISQLESGVIPWHKPWSGIRSGAFNRITKKPYSLINQMLLSHRGEYASYKQWHDIGGQVRKGEKAEIIVFWKIYKKEVEEEGKKKTVNIPLLRYLPVFHISQVDNVEPLKKLELKEINPIEEGQNILSNYWNKENIKVEHIAQNKAFYRPSTDSIVLPLMEQFINANEYYSTAFHESVHSTMHEKRCNRKSNNVIAAFGSDDYSKEELIAEIGSAQLMSVAGIETPKTFKNSSAYIQSWLAVLKNDIKFIISASSKAEKAVKYILNINDN